MIGVEPTSNGFADRFPTVGTHIQTEHIFSEIKVFYKFLLLVFLNARYWVWTSDLQINSLLLYQLS